MDLDAAFDKLLEEANNDEEERQRSAKKEKKKKEKRLKKLQEQQERGTRKRSRSPEAKPEQGGSGAAAAGGAPARGRMIEVYCNDRTGSKVRVKVNSDDTVGDLKKVIAAQSGHRADKIRLQKWYNVFKDHVKLSDYEIHDGMSLEMHYN